MILDNEAQQEILKWLVKQPVQILLPDVKVFAEFVEAVEKSEVKKDEVKSARGK